MFPRKDRGMIHAGSLAVRTLRVTLVQGKVVVSQRGFSQFLRVTSNARGRVILWSFSLGKDM